MDVSGQIKQLTWVSNKGWSLFWSQPRNQCEVYAFCGAYGTVPKDVPRQFGRLASNHGDGSLIQKLERSPQDQNKQGRQRPKSLLQSSRINRCRQWCPPWNE